MDIIEMVEMLSGFVMDYFGGDDFEGVGVYSSAENGTAKFAFRKGDKGYMLTLEEVDEEGKGSD